ncbi:hypothetical protein [Sphingomonas sp.]|uniref:hypothetical protein n=1 Tax=Sphingomonas sp. TaxID=28214 RepID=UPI003BAD9588
MTHTASAPNSRVRATAALVFALAQILAPLLPAIGIGNPVGEQSADTQTLITPAGWAFAIWGPLYFGTLVYVVYQLLPRHRDSDLVRRIGWHFALAVLGNALWVTYTQLFSLGFPSVLIIVFTLVNLLAILRIFASTATFSLGERLAVVLPLSALAGWLTAATIVNIAAALNFHGIALPAPAPLISAAILIVGGVIVAAALVGTGGNPWYPIPFLWALFAIHQKAGQVHDEIATATIVAGLLVIATLVVMLASAERRKRYLG